MGRRGSEKPANVISPATRSDLSSSSYRWGRVTTMQSLISPWQKRMVAKRMIRISRTVNSLLSRLCVIWSARSGGWVVSSESPTSPRG